MNGNLVVIGVSTGGPIALRQLFSRLPVVNAAFVVVLHISPGMDYKIASGLDAVSAMPVSLARDGEHIRPGQVYLAPGGFHLTLEGNSKIVLQEGPRVNYVQPSADVTMKSLHRPLRKAKLIGVVMTGMGKDGAEGIRHIKSLGGTTFSQDRESSAIYGMPQAALQTGAVDYEFPPHRIADRIVEILTYD